MKKVRLLLFFVLISTIGIAQEFSPVGATWYYGFYAPQPLRTQLRVSLL